MMISIKNISQEVFLYENIFIQDDKIYKLSLPYDISTAKLIYQYKIDSSNIDNELFILNFFLKYEKECYNDSTYNGSWKFIITDTLGTGLYAGYDKYVYRWIHKEPTFADFIQWLKFKKQ